MQTMKKEDMEKEREQLIMQVGHLAFHILQPLATILPGVGRLAYLQQELDKLKPIYKPKLEVSKDDKVAEEKTPDPAP